MNDPIKDTLIEYKALLLDVSNEYQYERLFNRVGVFLLNTFSKETKDEFEEIAKTSPSFISDWPEKVQSAIGYIEALIVKCNTARINIIDSVESPTKNNLHNKSNLVFIVHGRDDQLKETVARFIQNIGLEPIILHEQASSSNTVFEKLEKYSNVSFSIVLLTPDDLGHLAGEKDKVNKRARQNVILELGYFIGKLGRSNVCALKKDEIELPSDYHGIIYINVDPEGAWKTKLAQEIVESGIKINIEGIIKK